MEMAHRHPNTTVPTAVAVSTANVYNTTATRDIDSQPSDTPPVDYIDLKGKHACQCFGFLVAALIICCTIPLSFHYVSYDQYALLRDVYGTVRLSKVYEQGDVFLGYFMDFLMLVLVRSLLLPTELRYYSFSSKLHAG